MVLLDLPLTPLRFWITIGFWMDWLLINMVSELRCGRGRGLNCLFLLGGVGRNSFTESLSALVTENLSALEYEDQRLSSS